VGSTHGEILVFEQNHYFNIILKAANYGEGNAYRILVGKPEGKRPLGRIILTRILER
jgi:hypothetical protein